VTLSPRRRIVVGCLAMALLGLAADRIYHDAYGAWTCNSTLVRVSHICSLHGATRPTAEIAIWLVLIAVVVLLAIGLGIWCLQPIGELTSMLRRLGPQNLAERGPVGRGQDETARLRVAVNEMMDRLAAGYEAHELRTPLAVQRTLIEVSMAGARSPDQVALLTEQLLATNERNERLIEGLLVLSESDRGLVSRTPQRLDQIVVAVLDAHRDMARTASVSLLPEVAPCVVPGEQVLLERLVTNLVRNAIAYNVEGGSVLVAVGGDPTLVVENTGGPIASESVGGLFEPFRRGTSDRTHHGGGAGLGLTIVRSIAQAHDGSVLAQPGPRGGLRVEVALPSGEVGPWTR
jgi:signal transduction histidine kinase